MVAHIPLGLIMTRRSRITGVFVGIFVIMQGRMGCGAVSFVTAGQPDDEKEIYKHGG
jgi:hypothetical protein